MENNVQWVIFFNFVMCLNSEEMIDILHDAFEISSSSSSSGILL